MASGIYTQLVSRVLFPLHEALKGHDTVRRLRLLQASQWCPLDRVQALQLENLRRFLVCIGRDVSYYRDLFRGIQFDPSSLTSLADLRALPFLDKRAIREHTEALKSTTAGKLVRYNTGGSSGEPLVFYMGMDRVSQDVAAKWRATRWWDVDIGDKELVIWGSPIELGTQDRVKKIRDWVLRTDLLSAFEMSKENLDAFVSKIKSTAPAMLFGYPSALALIAQHARSKAIDLRGLGIKVAFVTSEKLYDHQRSLIEDVLGCPVANGYGGRDAGFIAHQCPAGSMHITAEEIIVETIQPDGTPSPPGVAGEIVITNTATREFPFLRYRTGDIGILDDRLCSCGRGLPVLREIQGRSTDFLISENGDLVHGLALIYILRDLKGIESFKIIQESRFTIRILIVVNSDLQDQARDDVVNAVKKRMGNGMTVDLTIVDQIPSEVSGKFRYVVNKVTQ